MKKTFLINISILLAANLIIKPFYVFGIDRTVQNMVGSEIYGVYITIFNLTMLFQIVSDFGIRYLNNREIAQNPNLFEKYFSNLIVFKGILAVLYIGFCYLVAFILEYDAYYFQMLTIMLVSQLLMDFILYLRSNVSGLQYYLQDTLLSISDKLLMIIFCVVLIWFNPFQEAFQIEWFIYAQVIANIITIGLAFWVVRKHLKGIQFRFNRPFLINIIKKTSAYALAVFLMSVYVRSDVIIMERILPDGAKESGIYYSAYRLIAAANMIGVLFSGLLLPMFARLLKEKKPISDLLTFSFQVLFAMLIVGSINVIFFRAEIMIALYDEGNAYSGDILGILMASFIATGATYIFGSLITANDNMRALNILYGIAMVLNVALNFIFIPQYQAIGAAFVTLITQFFVWIGLMYLTRSIFKININYRFLARMTLFVLTVLGINLIIINSIQQDWLILFFLTTFLSLVSAFVFKLIDIKGIRQLLLER